MSHTKERKNRSLKKPVVPDRDPRLDVLDFPPEEQQIQYSISGQLIDMPLLKSCGFNDSKGIGVVGWHSNPGIEMIIVLDGRTVREMRDRKAVQFIGGQFLVIPPGVQHRPQWNPNRPCKLCWLNFDTDSPHATQNTPFTRQDLSRLNHRFRSASGRVFDASPRLTDLFKSLPKILAQMPGGRSRKRKPDSRRPADQKLSLTLRIVLAQIISEATDCLSNRDPVHENEYVHAAQDYIRAHMRETIHFSQVARHVGFGKSWLYRKFKEATGLTPNDYLIRIRHIAACKMLIYTQKSITTIAMEVGYTSSQYFCRIFRRYSGQTPTAFRRSSQKGI